MPAKDINVNGKMDDKKIKKSMEVLKCLAHPVRLSIIKFIHSEGEVHVNKIYSSLKLEQSITSQHLRVLRNHDIVDTTRNGKFILYTVNTKRLQYISNRIDGLMQSK